MRNPTPQTPAFSSLPTQTPHDIVVIDASLENLQQLLDALPVGSAVQLLDEPTRALAQLADLVAHHPGLQTLHLISHGAPGALLLGEQTLCLDTLPRHADTLARLREHMAAEGEWLIYGCEVAQGDTGRAFVQTLREHTGLKIAAASHKVGHEELGGRWVLDVLPEAMHSQPLVAGEWRGVLAGAPELDLNGSAPGTAYEVDFMNEVRTQSISSATFTSDLLTVFSGGTQQANIGALPSYGKLQVSYNKTAFTDGLEESIELFGVGQSGILLQNLNTPSSTTPGIFDGPAVFRDYSFGYSFDVVGDIVIITFTGVVATSDPDLPLEPGHPLAAADVEKILDNLAYVNPKEILQNLPLCLVGVSRPWHRLTA